jgi:uncharacterized protein involved in exopolysaccharide biosynthesis
MATLQTIPEAALAPAENGTGVTAIAVRSFFYAVFKHSRLVVGVFLLIFLVTVVTAVLRPTTWMAESKVLVKLGETAQLAPAESTSKSVYLPIAPEVVKTEADIIKATETIREAVARVGVEPEPGTSMEEMISKMQLALNVTPLPGSNTLDITYVGRSPDRAARMLNAIVEVYMERHSNVYRSQGMHKFYQHQLRVLETQMKSAQRRLRRYLQAERVIDVDQEIDLLNRDLVEQERTWKTHVQKIHGMTVKAKEVHAQLDKTPTQIAFSEDWRMNPSILTYKNKLAELEVDRLQAMQAYLPTDRHVTDRDEEIAKIKEQLHSEKNQLLTDQEFRASDLHHDIQKNVYTIEALLSDLHARAPEIRDRLIYTRQRVRDLRNRRFVINQLKQDADLKSYAYELFRKRGEEARAQEAMTNQSMVNVAVVQHATPPIDPVNGLLLPLLLGLVGGLALASGIAVAVEYLNRRLRFEEEVERYLELPVLAVIPDLSDSTQVAQA